MKVILELNEVRIIKSWIEHYGVAPVLTGLVEACAAKAEIQQDPKHERRWRELVKWLDIMAYAVEKHFE